MKKLRSTTIVTWLLILSVMGTWLISMAGLTVVTAQEIYDSLYERSHDYSGDIARYGILHEFYDGDYFRKEYQYERPD